MNRIFKVIWSKSKACYVVVSEYAMNHGKTKSSKSVVSATSVNEGTSSLAKASWRVALATVALCGMASFANPAQASYIFIDDGNVGSNEMVNWKGWEAIALNPWFQGDGDHARSNYWGDPQRRVFPSVLHL